MRKEFKGTGTKISFYSDGNLGRNLAAKKIPEKNFIFIQVIAVCIAIDGHHAQDAMKE